MIYISTISCIYNKLTMTYKALPVFHTDVNDKYPLTEDQKIHERRTDETCNYHKWIKNGTNRSRDAIIKMLEKKRKKNKPKIKTIPEILSSTNIYNALSYGDVDESRRCRWSFGFSTMEKLTQLREDSKRLYEHLLNIMETKQPDMLEDLTEKKKKNFIYHIACKSKDFYNTICQTPEIARYLLPNNYLNIFDEIEKEYKTKVSRY